MHTITGEGTNEIPLGIMQIVWPKYTFPANWEVFHTFSLCNQGGITKMRGKKKKKKKQYPMLQFQKKGNPEKQYCLWRGYFPTFFIKKYMVLNSFLKYLEIKALQALHDIPSLFLFLWLHMFWHKKISMKLPDLIKSTNYFTTRYWA